MELALRRCGDVGFSIYCVRHQSGVWLLQPPYSLHQLALALNHLKKIAESVSHDPYNAEFHMKAPVQPEPSEYTFGHAVVNISRTHTYP